MGTQSSIEIYMRDLVLALMKVEAQLASGRGGRGCSVGGSRAKIPESSRHTKPKTTSSRNTADNHNQQDTRRDLVFTLQSIINTIAYIDLTTQHISASVVSEVCELWRAHREAHGEVLSQNKNAALHIWAEVENAFQFLERRIQGNPKNALSAKGLIRRCVNSTGLIWSEVDGVGQYASSEALTSLGKGRADRNFTDTRNKLKFSQDIHDRATLPTHPPLGDLARNSAFRARHRHDSIQGNAAYIYTSLQRSLVGGNSENMMAGSHLLDRVGTTTPQSVSAATEAFETLLDMMRPVHMQMALGNATENTMAHALAIMTLLYNMLTLHPAVLKNYLEAAANAIEPFTIWPSPYGDVALLVISALYLEEKSPGISMWKRALDDMPVLTHHGQHISDICMETIESALMQESAGELHEGTLDRTLSNDVLPSNEMLGAKATSNTRCRDASLGSPAGMAGDRFKLADLRASLRTSVRMSVSGYSYASPPGSPKRTQATKPRRSPLAPPKHSTPDSLPSHRNTTSERDIFNPLGNDLSTATSLRAASSPLSPSQNLRLNLHAPYTSRNRSSSRFSSDVPSLRWSAMIRERSVSTFSSDDSLDAVQCKYHRIKRSCWLAEIAVVERPFIL